MFLFYYLETKTVEAGQEVVMNVVNYEPDA